MENTPFSWSLADFVWCFWMVRCMNVLISEYHVINMAHICSLSCSLLVGPGEEPLAGMLELEKHMCLSEKESKDALDKINNAITIFHPCFDLT